MKFFTKQRTIILTALFAVIAVLLTIIITADLTEQVIGTIPDDPAAAAVHEKQRDARVGLAEHVEWENNFGGAGDDIPLAGYTVSGKTYIFGITTSTDLDFDGGSATGSAYAARLSGFGKTEVFTVLGEGVTYVRPVLINDGFALAVSGKTDAIVYIDLDLNITHTTALTDPETCGYEIADIGSYNNQLMVFRESTGGAVRHTVCDVLSSAGSLIAQKLFKRELSLTYIGFFPGATLITVFSENGSSASYTAFAEWTVSGSISYKHFTQVNQFKTLAAIPGPSGWLLLINQSGVTYAASIDSQYGLKTLAYINFFGCNYGELFYSSATTSYYAVVYAEGEVSGLYSLGSGGTAATKVDNFPAFSSLHIYNTSQYDVIAACSSGNITLVTMTKNGLTPTKITDFSKSPVIMRSGDNWFLAFAGEKKAAISGDNYGGFDTVVAKLKF